MMTVLIATRNGAEWLVETLDAFTSLEAPPGGWKLVVVDNGSTDGTISVLDGFRGRLPLQILREPRAGKNAALNRGLPVAEGDLLVLTDDDVLPDADWLVALRGIADEFPEDDVFGGTIEPRWPREPEPWITAQVPLGIVYTLTVERTDGPCDPLWIWGPNMMIRSRLLADGMRFDETVGPDGTETYRMGSETTFTRTLAARGARCRHDSRARVRHIIRPHQMERRWIIRRAFRSGRGHVERWEEFPTIVGVPRYVYRKLAEAAGRRLLAGVLLGGDRSFRAEWELSFWRGVFHEARRRRASRRPGLAGAVTGR